MFTASFHFISNKQPNDLWKWVRNVVADVLSCIGVTVKRGNQNPSSKNNWFQSNIRERRPVTSLGHQVGRRVFWEGPKFF